MTQISLARKKSSLIQELYNSGLSVWKISKEINIGGQTIHKHLKEIGFKTRSKSESIRTHSLNEDSFENIDTHEKAYWLGLLFADGNVYLKKGTYVLSITLHRNDRYVLDKFKLFLNSSHPIHDRKDKLASSISIGNKKICLDLIKKGMVPRKSLALEYPLGLDNKYANSFILGYFDGDGCIHSRSRKRYLTKQTSVNLVGTKEFLEKVSLVISKNLQIPVRPLYKNNKVKIYNLSYEGLNRVETLLKWLYKDSPFYFKRKHKIYIDDVVNNKTETNRINKLKTVVQLDLNGNFIREWESGIEAHRVLKINKSNIYKCCVNKLKSSNGFIWKYKKDYDANNR